MYIYFDFELTSDDIQELHYQFNLVKTKDWMVLVNTNNIEVSWEEFLKPWLESGYMLSYDSVLEKYTLQFND